VIAAVREARAALTPGWPYARDPGDEPDPPDEQGRAG
jgi:hypothetical protein